MQLIVVAAKAGTEQEWLADAAAEVARQMDAKVAVVSFDGSTARDASSSDSPSTFSSIVARK